MEHRVLKGRHLLLGLAVSALDSKSWEGQGRGGGGGEEKGAEGEVREAL